MSFIYIKNNRGPKIDPCGTPQVISFLEEVSSFIVTVWLLWVRYYGSQIETYIKHPWILENLPVEST